MYATWHDRDMVLNPNSSAVIGQLANIIASHDSFSLPFQQRHPQLVSGLDDQAGQDAPVALWPASVQTGGTIGKIIVTVMIVVIQMIMIIITIL